MAAVSSLTSRVIGTICAAGSSWRHIVGLRLMTCMSTRSRSISAMRLEMGSRKFGQGSGKRAAEVVETIWPSTSSTLIPCHSPLPSTASTTDLGR
jgi:hypothetical protein